MKAKQIDVNDNCFDIIRLVCTFTIFLGHFIVHFEVQNDWLHNIAFSIRGVPIFFFLSGFFIARSIERYNAKEFLKRRAVRIFPELWVCVCINLLLILLSGIKGSIKDILVYLGTQMTAFQFYTGSWLRNYGIGVPNGALWTITVDIQFYLLASFVGKWMKNQGILRSLFFILLFVIVDIVCEKTKSYYPEVIYKLLQCNVLSFLWIFLIGMTVYYHRDRIISILVQLRWLLVVLYFLWRFWCPDSITAIFDGIRYNIISTGLLLAMIIGIGFSFKMRLKQDFSYSFYLYHMVIINFIINNIYRTIVSTKQFFGIFVICIISTGIMAFLSRYYIEGKLVRYIEAKYKREKTRR